MTTYELKQLFRSYADEPDSSFLSDADIELYLKMGYNRFRAMVNSVDEMRYATQTDVSISGSKSITLSASGIDPETILSVAVLDGDSMPSLELMPVSRPAELFSVDRGRQVVRYHHIDGKLNFSGELSSTIRITYIPKSNIAWSTGSPGAAVDSLDMYHDLIVLLAYSNYSIRDGDPNQILMMQLQERKMEFQSFLMEGAVREQATVIDDPDWL